jgi:hypothetical protein
MVGVVNAPIQNGGNNGVLNSIVDQFSTLQLNGPLLQEKSVVEYTAANHWF